MCSPVSLAEVDGLGIRHPGRVADGPLLAPAISARMELAPVTGRLTYSGKPLKGMTLCLDSPGGVHCAYATLRSDGSFAWLT